jgi:predicted nuclease of predicted toxin-antitoxin system
MRFLIDAHLPPSLKLTFADLGHEAVHVFDLGLGDMPDAEIWAYALRESCVILTKDEDFAIRRKAVANGPGILWIRRPNTRRAAMATWLSALLPLAVEAFERGEILVEIA